MNASSMTLAFDELDSEQSCHDTPPEWRAKSRAAVAKANALSQNGLFQEGEDSCEEVISIQGKVTVSF